VQNNIIVRAEAEAELSEAYDWYNVRMVGLGDQFFMSVDATIQAISRNPNQFPEIYKTIRRALIHRFPYAIFFVVEESQIIILAIFHAKRNPKQWKERFKSSF